MPMNDTVWVIYHTVTGWWASNWGSSYPERIGPFASQAEAEAWKEAQRA